MRSFAWTFSIISILTIMACSKNENPDNNPGNGKTPINLECSYDSRLSLTNHNSNGVDYIIDCDFYMYSGELVIEPGTTIQFNDGASIEISGTATIRAQGTAENPIRFTNRGVAAPSWAGLYIATSGIGSSLDHCIIERAGAVQSFGLLNPTKSSITIENSDIKITNCQIVDFGESGITFLDKGVSSSFSNNSFRNGNGYPIIIHPYMLNQTDLSLNTFTNNRNNFIFLDQSNSTTNNVNVPLTIRKNPIPYYIAKPTYIARTSINAGVEMIFGTEGSLVMDTGDAYIEVNGTPSQHVVMRGENAGEARWGGMVIDGGSDLNVLNYLDMSDGGRSTHDYGNLKGNLKIAGFNRTKVVANNCTFTRSGACDIVLDISWSEKIFENNNSGNPTVCED